MFMTKLKTIPVVLLIACALAAGAAGVLAQQEAGSDRRPTSDRPTETRSDAKSGRRTLESSSAPSFIRQSRTMIITRLEQELGVAKKRLEHLRRTVRSPDDPVVLHTKRTVVSLDDLLARIDTVLVEAVDKYPTVFDFSRGLPDDAPGSLAGVLAPRKAEQAKDRPGDKSDDEKKWDARARVQIEWAQAEARLDWAKRMFEKGFVSKSNYQSEVLKLYDVFKARLTQKPVDPEVLKHYEALKARLKELTASPGAATGDERTTPKAAKGGSPESAGDDDTPRSDREDGPPRSQ